ncbi:MAG: hypothetical protein CMP49_05165 [Flavobacteriales bacterium]|jgi:hypothetical protein|nr:hypothetical protein [Flavobacteriales bacterium]
MAFYLNDIHTIILFFSIFMASLLMFNNKDRLLSLLEYPFNQKYSLLYHRKDSILFIVFNSINVLLVFGIIISFYLLYLQKELSIQLFLKSIIILLLFFTIKCIGIYFINWAFELNDTAKKYYYGYTTSLMFCTIIFTPIIFFISYLYQGSMIINLSFPLFILFAFTYFIMKVVLISRLNLFKIHLIFYNILYLCGLELLPYVILFELLRIVN